MELEQQLITYQHGNDISDSYRISNRFNNYTNYNINFNFDFHVYYKTTPFVIQNKLRNKPVNSWEDDEFNHFFTLINNGKKFYTQSTDLNTIFYHEYAHILGQHHENLQQRLNMDQVVFGYLPVFSHEIIYI